MYFAEYENGKRVSIDNYEDGKKVFCEQCKTEMVAKRGKIVVHHFAHKCNSECDSWYNENCNNNKSPWHREMQAMFDEDWQEKTVTADGKIHRTDVAIPSGNSYLFTEFQISPMNHDTFLERTRFYQNQGQVVWVFNIENKDVFRDGDEKFISRRKLSALLEYSPYSPLKHRNHARIILQIRPFGDYVITKRSFPDKDGSWVEVDYKEGINKSVEPLFVEVRGQYNSYKTFYGTTIGTAKEDLKQYLMDIASGRRQ